MFVPTPLLPKYLVELRETGSLREGRMRRVPLRSRMRSLRKEVGVESGPEGESEVVR